jgi:hypothetical protein
VSSYKALTDTQTPDTTPTLIHRHPSMQHRCLVACCPSEGKIVHTNEIFHNIQLIVNPMNHLKSNTKCERFLHFHLVGIL